MILPCPAHLCICPKQGHKIEGVLLHRVGMLGFFPIKIGMGAPLHLNMTQVPPPPKETHRHITQIYYYMFVAAPQNFHF